MMAGALKFGSFLERHLCQPAHSFSTSVPAIYVVHRESQHSVEEVCSYLETVHSLVREAAEGKNGAYFAKDLRAPLRTLSASEKENEFNPAVALAAVSTPEVAINPTALAAALRKCVDEHPKIEVRCNCNVIGAKKEDKGVSVLIESLDRTSEGPFDHVVNALWDGRFALNETLGYRTNRPWLHKLKYGVSFRLPAIQIHRQVPHLCQVPSARWSRTAMGSFTSLGIPSACRPFPPTSHLRTGQLTLPSRSARAYSQGH